MLDCLKNKVTWWNGCGSRPNLLLLNNLPGFDISFADWVTDDQKKTAAEVLDSCIENGAQKTEDDVRGFMLPDQTAVEAFQNQSLGIISENQKERAQDGNLYGVRLDLCRSRFLALQINRVSFFPKESGTGKIYVYDLLTGVKKDEEDVTFTGGQVNSFVFDRTYTFGNQPINVAIVMETTAVVYDVQPYGRDTSCSACRLSGRYVNEWMYADAVKIDPTLPKIENNAKSAQHTGGLIVNYNFICDISDYICGQSAALKLAVWYASGISAMDEITYSSRISSTTTVGKDNALALREAYQNEYASIMKRVQDSTVAPKSPCFRCNQRVTVSSRIP